jgi:putative acyl-CoA dehydrogenase
MRQALLQAIHHASYRRAFGRLLIEQPLMRNVLGDLALESEAATALALRLARAFDRARDDPREAAFRRLATALGKFWVCKRGPAVVGEALECLGGNGYVEESGMPRLYREMPLNAIWEGSGNVIALDALRAMARQPETVEAFRAELLQAKGEDDAYDAALAAFERRLHGVEAGEAQARRTVEEMALLLQASLLIRHEPHALASAFTASRLDPDRALGFGALPDGCDLGAILDRAAVAPIS